MGNFCAVGFVSGGGDFCFGAGFGAGAVAFPFDAAVPTTTAGATYFVSCRFYFKVRCENLRGGYNCIRIGNDAVFLCEFLRGQDSVVGLGDVE